LTGGLPGTTCSVLVTMPDSGAVDGGTAGGGGALRALATS
jgi:hypothetical protein